MTNGSLPGLSFEPMWYGLIMLILSTVVVNPLVAQPVEQELRSYINRINEGQTEEARRDLPDLVAKYQNTAGILYLQGRLATDGIEAVKFYQGVVDNFPKSEYADDALHRIYQYYYALGLYRTAELKLQQLKKDYPRSPHVTGKPVTALPRQEESPVSLPSKDTVLAQTPKPHSSSSTHGLIPSPAPSPSGGYVLQVGAFSTVVNAEKQKNFFEDLGYPVEVTNKVRGGRSLHLVWVGNFDTADEARKFAEEVRTKYKVNSIVVERY